MKSRQVADVRYGKNVSPEAGPNDMPRRWLRHTDLEGYVMQRLHKIPKKIVRRVLYAYLDEVKMALAYGAHVTLHEIGSLRLTRGIDNRTVILQPRGETLEVPIRYKFYGRFQKSAALKREINKVWHRKERDGTMMEKYGVDEDGADLEKAAAEGCPLCGRPAERHGALLICPTHGSEPFEKNRKTKK